MPERTDAIGEAARQALSGWRALLDLSRPGGWPAAAIPFAIGAYEVERGWSVGLILGVIYFLAPFGLLRRGFRAMAATDAPPAASGAAALDPAAIRLAIAVTNLPLLAAIILVGGAATGWALAATVGLTIALSWAPLRLTERPVVDIAGEGLLLALPAIAGLVLGATGMAVSDLPWPILGALWAWGVGNAAIVSVRGQLAGGAAQPNATSAPTGTIRYLGERPTAGVALTGFAVAAVLLAAIGGLGTLAAVGILPFLLVPVMVLAAPSDAIPDAAERAMKALASLTILAGTWLVILLAQHWGVTAWRPWTVAIVVPTALAGLVLANIVATRLATRRRRVPAALGPAGPEDPSLTIVVPCRDAIDQLPMTLAALRAQTYADTTILVVDDGSTDGSPAEVAVWLGEDAVIAAPARPAGRTSRDWARHVGASTSTTELVLFVDVGTTLAPVATRILVEQLRAGRLTLLSGVTRHAMPTPGERAGVPGFPLLLFGAVPIWWSAITRGRPSATAFAHDSLLLVDRAAYLEAAGDDESRVGPPHASRLARRIAGAGGRVGTVHAARLGATRAIHGADAAVDRWRRGFVGGVGADLGAAIALIAAEVAAFVAPLLLPPIVILSGAGPDSIAASFIPLAVLFAARLVLALTQHHPIATVAWHPVTVGLMLVGQILSVADHVLGRSSDRQAIGVTVGQSATDAPA